MKLKMSHVLRLPIKPIVLPSTKRPLSEPISMYSLASSGVKHPLLRKRSTTATAIIPSTFKIRFGF